MEKEDIVYSLDGIILKNDASRRRNRFLLSSLSSMMARKENIIAVIIVGVIIIQPFGYQHKALLLLKYR